MIDINAFRASLKSSTINSNGTITSTSAVQEPTMNFTQTQIQDMMNAAVAAYAATQTTTVANVAAPVVKSNARIQGKDTGFSRFINATCDKAVIPTLRYTALKGGELQAKIENDAVPAMAAGVEYGATKTITLMESIKASAARTRVKYTRDDENAVNIEATVDCLTAEQVKAALIAMMRATK